MLPPLSRDDAGDRRRPPEELGAAGRRPGSQIDAVHLWSIANFPLLGRQVLAPFGLVDLDRDVPALATVLDFWKRAAAAFRADGQLQAWDAGLRVPALRPDVVDELVAGSRAGRRRRRSERLIRLNRVLTTFLFLLYFDTRAGYQDTGPYPLADGRVLLVRDFNRFGVGHFPWSRDVCADLPYSNLTIALVLDGDVRVTANDWGTSITDPPDYFARLVGRRGVHRRRRHALPCRSTSSTASPRAVKDAQRTLYRLIAGMSRREKLDAGAYVYFTFLRPFAETAGVDDGLDWTVPRDSLDLYEGLATLDKMPDVESDETMPYYTPIPRRESARDQEHSRRRGPHEPGRRLVLQRVVVLRLLARRRHRRLRPSRAVPQPAGRVVLGVRRVARARARRRARPRGPVARAATRSRCAPTACGPSACARRRWSTGASASRRSACVSTSPATPTGARSASVCPSVSTWSGRRTRPSTTTRTPTTTRAPTTSTPGSCTARCSSARSASRSRAGASVTTRGATATGGCGAGTGRRSRSATRFAANVVKADEMEGGVGYVWDGRRGLRPVSHLMLETHLGADDIPTAARYVIDHELEVDVEVMAAAPVPLVAPDGRTSRFPRRSVRYTTSEGTGTGWCEWLQVGCRLARHDETTRTPRARARETDAHVPRAGRRDLHGAREGRADGSDATGSKRPPASARRRPLRRRRRQVHATPTTTASAR